MPTAYQQLETRFHRLDKLDHALTILSWDQQVMMPAQGNDSRSNTIAELATLKHEWLTAKDMGSLIENAEQESLTADQNISLGEIKRTWLQADCLPTELVKAQSLAISKCEYEWREHRQNNDWDSFQPNLEAVVKLAREEAQIRCEAGGFNSNYDAMLDLYAAGDSSEFIATVFEQLRNELPGLLTEIQEHQKQQPASLPEGDFPIALQTELSHQLMSSLGFNFNAGRLDVSSHPFSTGVPGDQRITTRYTSQEFAEALFATAHETGHASYEAGLPKDWQGLPVGQARSMSIHESQSLLFEKQIFLAKPFVNFFTPQIHKHLPATKTHSADQLWAGFTKVEPGYIRVEADEVSYPLHVILRYEIESKLINGQLEVSDIPALWHNRMQHYLGLNTEGNYKDGCMQDIHWPGGAFGYFPSYTLGALNAAQMFATIKQQHSDWESNLEKGDIGFIREWLGENIWSKASLFTTNELMSKATGETTKPAYFLDHIRSRYLTI